MSDYHPRRHDKEISDGSELTRMLEDGKYATLALCRDNEPYIVTLSYGYDAPSDTLYFHSGLKGEKIAFIEANPRTCATIIEDGGYLPGKCEHAYSSLVIRGDIGIVRELEEKKHALAVILDHLERDPEPILKRNISSDSSYDKIHIFRLSISSKIGKRYQA